VTFLNRRNVIDLDSFVRRFCTSKKRKSERKKKLTRDSEPTVVQRLGAHSFMLNSTKYRRTMNKKKHKKKNSEFFLDGCLNRN